jgi:hypothetical protein
MKKLEDIPKKEVFNTPEGYFDSLPSRIQSRIQEKEGKRESVFTVRAAWRFALPVIALLAVGIFWFTMSDDMSNAESILSSVRTEDLMTYLAESDMSTDELIDAAEFNMEDLDDIEGQTYDLLDLNLDETDFDELDLENVPADNE